MKLKLGEDEVVKIIFLIDGIRKEIEEKSKRLVDGMNALKKNSFRNIEQLEFLQKMDKNDKERGVKYSKL